MINYVYGARPPHLNRTQVEDQMRAAWRYRNDLVRVELDARQAVLECERKHEPAIASAEANVAAMDKAIIDKLSEIAAQNSAARKKRCTDEDRESLKALRAQLKEARLSLRTLRADTRARPEVAEDLRSINTMRAERKKALYNGCTASWGTRLQTAEAAERSCREINPRFTPWTGDGEIAVQIQINNALTTSDLMAQANSVAGSESGQQDRPADTRIQIGPRLPGRKDRRMVKMRIGSNADRTPIWTEFKITLHRPLPPGQIKWVRLFRRRVGTCYHWDLMFTIDAPLPEKPRASSGTVGIDLGWRLLDTGELRVAYWVGSDEAEGELRLPADLLDDYRYAEGVQEIRDRNRNAVRTSLSTWLEIRRDELSEWLQVAARYVQAWKKSVRFQSLLDQWRGDRVPGDEAIVDELERWAKQDRHLWNLACGIRKRIELRVRHLQRNFAANMRRHYKTAHVEKMNVRELTARPTVDDSTNEEARRRFARLASIGRLRDWIAEAMTETVAVPAKNTTRGCCHCGHVQDFNRIKLVRHCEGCGVDEDQDRNAAINLLHSQNLGNFEAGGGPRSPQGPRAINDATCGKPIKRRRIRANRRRSQQAAQETTEALV